MKVLLLDNYDSFTFNLLHYLEQLCENVEVKRNDEIELSEVDSFSHIVISPGPGLPKEAGITRKIIEYYHDTKAILGICLGCQALGEIWGASLYNQKDVAHGIQRKVFRTDQASWLLKNLPDSFDVGLYHSWAIDKNNLNTDIRITAINQKQTLMALEHEYLPVAGVQFHPESIMSEYGLKILKNWCDYSLHFNA